MASRTFILRMRKILQDMMELLLWIRFSNFYHLLSFIPSQYPKWLKNICNRGPAMRKNTIICTVGGFIKEIKTKPPIMRSNWSHGKNIAPGLIFRRLLKKLLTMSPKSTPNPIKKPIAKNEISWKLKKLICWIAGYIYSRLWIYATTIAPKIPKKKPR